MQTLNKGDAMSARNATLKFDIVLGKKIRALRLRRAISQVRLAALLAEKLSTHAGRTETFTFQQIQKYESGANRVSASVLLLLAEILETPVLHFYEQDIIPLQYPVTPVPEFTPQIMRLIYACQKVPTATVGHLIALVEWGALLAKKEARNAE